MNNPLIVIVNCLTGEETTREMTDEEYAAYLESISNAQPLPNEA